MIDVDRRVGPARPPSRQKSAPPLQPSALQLLAVLAAIACALSPAEPTGSLLADTAWTGALGAVAVFAGARARRPTWLWLAGSVAVGAEPGPVLALAVVLLLVATVGAFLEPRRPWIGSLVGAAGAALALRLDLGPTGAETLLGTAAITPLLISGYRTSSRRTRRRARRLAAGVGLGAAAATLLIAAQALSARTTVEQAVRAAERGLDLARAGNSADAASEFERSSSGFRDVENTLGVAWAVPASAVPLVSQNTRAIRDLSRSGGALAESARRAASDADVDALRAGDGRIDLTAVRAMEEPLFDSLVALQATADRLQASRSPWLLPAITDRMDGLAERLARQEPDVALVLAGVRAVPGLLGGDGPRRYFVAFTTPTEARGIGGFMGNWAELLAEDGGITLARFGRTAELNSAGGEDRTLVGPPGYLARYGFLNAEHTWQNVTASPDFPTVASVIAELYPQSGGTEIDGVILVDPVALGGILRLTGPVDLASTGDTLTADNAVDFLLRGQYEDIPDREFRETVLAEASAATFRRLVTADIGGPRDLAAAVGEAVQQDRLLAWARQPGEQAFLSSLGADGADPLPNNDLLGLVTQNASANKIDYFLRRELRYDLMIDPVTGEAHAEVTIDLHNDAPAAGLADAFLGSQTDLPPGTNRTLLSVHSALRPFHATLDGQPVLISPQEENGHHVVDVGLDLAPGQSRTVVVRLAGQILPIRVDDGSPDPDEPAGDAAAEARPSATDVRSGYRLDLLAQPLVSPDSASVVVRLEPGGRFVAGETTAGFDVDGPGTAATADDLTLDRDQVLELQLAGN